MSGVRYEVGVRTNLTFHTQGPPYREHFPPPETVVIEFEGRRFVWHAVGVDEQGEAHWPVVTTMAERADDYWAERMAMERFLSALAYTTHQPIEVVIWGATGWASEMARPTVGALRRGYGDYLSPAPLEVVTVGDDRLMTVLGYYRDGLNTDGPFYKFLAFWNALDVACEDAAGGLRAWVEAAAPRYKHVRGQGASQVEDWWNYLQNDRRNAVAHAIREPGRGEELDPNDPDDRGKLGTDARLLDELVQARIQERWGDFAVWRRPRPD
jgi:hypothetical protein